MGRKRVLICLILSRIILFHYQLLYPLQDCFAEGSSKNGVRIGDLNKDGKKDLVISSYRWPDGSEIGRIFIYMGNNIPSSTPDYIIDNNLKYYSSLGGYFEVGDINADGYDDLLFSQNLYTKTAPRVDSLHILYVYYGSPNPSFDISNPSLKYESHVNY